MSAFRPPACLRFIGLVTASLLAVSACSGSGDSENDGNGGSEEGPGTVEMEHGLLLEEHEDWQYERAEDPDAEVPGTYDAVARLIPVGDTDSVAFAVSYRDDPMSVEDLEDAIDSELYAHTSQFQLGSWSGEDVSSAATTISDYPAHDKRHVVQGDDGERYSRLIMVAADDETVMLFGFAEGEYRDQLNTMMDTLELEQ